MCPAAAARWAPRQPEERAVLLLREVLEYSYREIASILKSSEGNCRQLFHRAKGRLASGRTHSRRSRQDGRALAERVASAMRAGDRAELTRVLAEDVGFWGDGGGGVLTVKRPVLGRNAVVNLLLGFRRAAEASGIPLDKVSLEVTEVNYEPAMLVWVDGRLDSVHVCSVADDTITAFGSVRNPDKLVFLDRQLQAIHGA